MWPDISRASRADQIRLAARLLALLWAAWWTFFIWADVGPGITSSGSAIATVASLVLVGSATLAWQWERPGAILLFVEGLIALIAYPLLAWPIPLLTLFSLLLVVALPPLLAGAILLFTPHAAPAEPSDESAKWRR